MSPSCALLLALLALASAASAASSTSAALAHHDTSSAAPPPLERRCREEPPAPAACSAAPGGCLRKCCAAGAALLHAGRRSACAPHAALAALNVSAALYDYSSFAVFARDAVTPVGSVRDRFAVLFDRRFAVKGCSLGAHRLQPAGAYDPDLFRILEDGRLLFRRFNYLNNSKMVFAPWQYCLEARVAAAEEAGEAGERRYWSRLELRVVLEEPREPAPSGRALFTVCGERRRAESAPSGRALFTVCALMTSSFFLVLVLAVHALLPALRGGGGALLPAHVAALALAYAAWSLQYIGAREGFMPRRACQALSQYRTFTPTHRHTTHNVIFYVSFLSSVCWMNVLALDVRRALRASQTAGATGRGALLRRCAWALGVPLALAGFTFTVDVLDLRHLPRFVKPHVFHEPNMCSMLAAAEGQLYLFGPVLALSAVNAGVFASAACGLARLQAGVTRGLRRGDSRRHAAPRNRFCLYMKLSLVSGASWVLEAARAFLWPAAPLWRLADVYNALVGVIFFIFFVCNRRVALMLCKRFNIKNQWVLDKLSPSATPTSASTSGSASTVSLQQRPAHPGDPPRHPRDPPRHPRDPPRHAETPLVERRPDV